MEQSILRCTKKKLNVSPDDPSFDLDIAGYINTAFGVIHQLGVGPDDGFVVEDESAVWADLNLTPPMESLVQTIVFLRARLLFDPPGTSFHLTAFQDQLREHEVRLNLMREATQWTDPTPPKEPVDA